MANGFQGPVDAKTMLGMQGAIEQERGFARMWSAGANPTVQAAYQQSAANKGALAANNIRMRYYKKEWEQIQETQIKPLTDQLFRAEQAYKQATASTTMPVPSIKSPEEMQQRSELLQPSPPQITTVPGKPTKEGTQSQEAVEQPGPPAPNAALGQGQIGALEHTDALAIMDPTSGSPTILNSARGIELMNKAAYDFWEQNKRINIEMMDALSEFQGNPYAAQAQDGLMKNVTSLAGSGATGSLDPQAQQDWMNRQSQFAAEQAQREQDLSKGAFDFEQTQAKLDAQTADAQSMAADPKYGQYFDAKTLKKLQSGQPLTKKETANLAATRNMLRDLQEKGIARMARQGVFQVPAELVNDPANWQRVMARDDGYQHQYTLALMEAQNSMQAQLMSLPKAEMMSELGRMGASQLIQDRAAAGLWSDPDVATFVSMLANTPEIAQDANDTAYLLTLPDIERQQEALTPVIDGVLETGIRQIEARLAADGMAPMTEDQRGELRADRYRSFFELQTGRTAPQKRDVFTEGDVITQQEISQTRAKLSPSLIPGKEQGPFMTPEMDPGIHPPSSTDRDRNKMALSRYGIPANRLDANQLADVEAVLATQSEARRVEELPPPRDPNESSVWNQVLFPTGIKSFTHILPGLSKGRALGTETTQQEAIAASQE